MGLLSTIVSFGAGYTLGAKTGAAPIRRLQSGVARLGGRSGTPGVLPRGVQVRDVMTAARRRSPSTRLLSRPPA